MKQSNIDSAAPENLYLAETAGYQVSAILGKLALSALVINTIFAVLLFVVFALLDLIEDYIETVSTGPSSTALNVANLLDDWIVYLSFPLILLVIGLASVAINNSLFKNSRPLDKVRWNRFFWGDLIGFSVALVFLFMLISASGIVIPAVSHPSLYLVILFAGAALFAFLAGIAAIFLLRQVDVE